MYPVIIDKNSKEMETTTKEIQTEISGLLGLSVSISKPIRYQMGRQARKPQTHRVEAHIAP